MDIDTQPAAAEPALPALIGALIAHSRSRPFDWGVHDCCTFAGRAVQVQTGHDPLAALAWFSEIDAARLLRDLGGLRAAVTAALGQPIEPLLARAGDVVLATDPHDATHRHLLTVCHGGVLLVPGALGLVALPITAGLCAWRVTRA